MTDESSPPGDESPPPTDTSESRPSLLVSIALVVVLVLASAVVGTVLVVRGVVLDADTYASALVQSDAYERTYTEVFADPEMAAIKEDLLGRVSVSARFAPAHVRIVATNALRWTLPPSTLQAGTEALIYHLLSYIRGDTDTLDADVLIDGAVDRIDATAITFVRTLLADAADRTADTIDEFRDSVDEFVARLSAGTIPDFIPVIGGLTIDSEQVVDVIIDALGPLGTAAVRRQVTAAVEARDERNALISAAGLLITDHAADVAAHLRSVAENTRELDVVGEISDRAREPARSVVGSLDTVRDIAAWFQPITAIIAALIAIAAAAGLLWVQRASPRRAMIIVGGSLVIAGFANLAIWWFVQRSVASPLDNATGTGSGSWNLPSGLRSVLTDIQHLIVGDLTDAVRGVVLSLVVAGIVVAAIALVMPRLLALRPWMAITGGVAVVAIVALSSMTAAAVEDDLTRACNGHEELCDRHYDDVVYAATHNAMSSPDVVTIWPEHDGNIGAQLDAGVRALLIDSHYWPAIESPAALNALAAVAGPLDGDLPPSVVNAVYPALGDLRNGREGTFLCHIYCAFGSIPFVDAMISVREFLEANPDEVVTLIIQDAVTPEDTEIVIRDAGLEPYLFTHSPDAPWPTLGEMIDDGGRLVVFAEQEGPPPDWYANAFTEMKETPFLFLSPEQFSCAPNRGNEDATLFQMNHWVQRIAPDRVDSTNVNRLEVIVDRARQCERERGQLPNYIAVNHYNIGDLMEAVDVLNGVR